ncbi:hypothetical protein TNCV_1141771 [Trichonephila clavipes]|nr:hypothetical protein TNCV_1141771 [Trichonephila clavipes]
MLVERPGYSMQMFVVLVVKQTQFPNAMSIIEGRALGTLVVRASDSRTEGLGSMSDATKYPPSAHGVRAR